MLDELERLERDATPGPHRVSLKLGGCEVVDGQGEWLAEFERAEDAEHYAAARNALPALLRVARAARRMTGRTVPDEADWDELEAALAALDKEAL